MKKISKILMLVLSVALLVGAMIFVASAEEKSYEFDETNMAFVVYADEAAFKADKAANNGYANALGTYNDIADAVAGAKSKSAKYIALRNHWERGTKDFPKGTSSISLNVPGMTLDLNGYTMSFSVYSGYVKSDGTRATAYTWLGIGTSEGVTVVGNGGAIEATMSIFQHTTAGALNLVGGEGGLTLRAITGMSKKVSGSWTNDQLAENTEYSGGQIIKVGANNFSSNPSTSTLNISGKVTFERANTKTISAIAYWGATKVNIGTENGERSTVSYIDKTGTPGIGTQYDNGEATAFLQLSTDDKFDSGAQDLYATKTVSSSCNIVNTDIKIHLENFFYSETNFYKLADPKYNDDQQYLRIENSTIVGDGFASDFTDYKGQASNIPDKFFYSERISPVCIDIVESRIETYTRTFTFAYQNKSSSKVSFGYVHAVDSVFIGARADGTKGYPLFQSVGTALFENCSIFLGESVCSGGSPWLPYGQKFADGTDPVWPVFSEDLGGAGILIDSGCIFLDGSATSYGNSSGKKNDNGTWKEVPAKDHPGQNSGGYAQNTCVNINGYKTIAVYDLKTNMKGTMVTDDTKKVNHITTPTGINTFNSGVVGKVYKDGTAPSVGGSLSWVVTNSGNPRCGMLTVNASKTFDNETGKFIESTDNKYVTHNYWADTEGKTYKEDYYGYTNAPAFSAGDTNPPLYDIRDSGFYSVDFDLMTTEDEFTGMYFTLYIATVVGGEKKSDMVRLDLRRDGTLESNGIGKGKYKIDFTPGVWQHITTVLEMPTVEVEGKKVVDTANVTAKSKLHLYIDGKLVYTYDQPLPSGNVEKADSFDYCGLNDVRLGFQSSTYKNMYGERNTSIDNFAAARYPVSSTLAEASTYVLEAQKALGIEQPEDVPFGVAKISDGNYVAKDASYLEEFLVSSISGKAPKSFKLYTDYKGEVDALALLAKYGFTPATVSDFVINYEGNGKEIDFKDYDFIFESYDSDSDIYTIKKAFTVLLDDGKPETEDEYLVLDADNTLYVAKLPTNANPEAIELAYGKLLLDGWGTVAGKPALAEDLVLSGSTTLYPAIKSIKSTYTENLFFDFTLQDNLAMNFYIPVDALGGKVEGLTITDVQYHYEGGSWAKCPVASGEFTSNGIDYKKYTLWPSITRYNDDTEYKIIHTATYEGDTYTFEAVYRISAISYSQYVLENNYTNDEKVLVSNFLRYGREYLVSYLARNPNSSYKTKFNTAINDINAVLSEYEDKYCTQYDESIFTKNIIDTATVNAEISKYIGSISLSANDSRLQFVLNNFKSEVDGYQAKIQKISMTTKGPYVNQNGELTTTTVYFNTQTKATKDEATGTSYFTTEYKTQNTKPHYIFNEVTIVIEVDLFDAEGNLVTDNKQISGKYSLATYYSKLSDTSKENYKNLFLSLNELSKSANAYRYYEVK